MGQQTLVVLQAIEMIGTFVKELGNRGAVKSRDSHSRKALQAPGGALVRNLDAQRRQFRSHEDRLTALHGAWCQGLSDLVKRNAPRVRVLTYRGATGTK